MWRRRLVRRIACRRRYHGDGRLETTLVGHGDIHWIDTASIVPAVAVLNAGTSTFTSVV